jgi:hypothetical protein
MMKHLFCVGSVTTLLCFFSMQTYADHIDNYEDGSFFQSVSSAGPFSAVSTQSLGSGANGGSRMVQSFFVGGVGTAAIELSADNPDTFDDAFVLSVDSNADAMFMFHYDNMNADLLNIPGQNAMWDRLSLDYLSNTSGVATVMLETNGNFAIATASFLPGTDTLDFDYNSFVGDAIDFADIDSIMLAIPVTGNGAAGPASFSGFSFYRGGFVAIPEPGSALLAFGSIIGMLVINRRHRCR